MGLIDVYRIFFFFFSDAIRNLGEPNIIEFLAGFAGNSAYVR